MATSNMSGLTVTIAGALVLAGVATSGVAVHAQARGQAPAAAAAAPEQLGALAPANLKKPRPKPPFDLTGTWFIDFSKGFDSWRSGPPYRNSSAKAPRHSPRASRPRRKASLPRLHRPVLSGRDAGHHDARLADRDDPVADRHLHGQRVRERPAHHLSGWPQAHARRRGRADF